MTSFKAPVTEREKRFGEFAKPIDYDRLPAEQWLWCLHCEKFFQKKNLRMDDVGNRQGCAFYGECGGAGFGVDIYIWDDWAISNELKHWPKSISELSAGAYCPLYPRKNWKFGVQSN